MQLQDLIDKTPSQMSDEEINEMLHRLRTSRVVEGKIVGQTRTARKKASGIKSLMKLGLSEADAAAVIEKEMAEKGTNSDGGIELGQDETIIP